MIIWCGRCSVLSSRWISTRSTEEAKQRLEAQRAQEQEDGTADPAELDLGRLGDRRGGRRGWLRNGRRQLEEHRERESRPVARSRVERLKDAKQRLEQQLAVEAAVNAAYERDRVDGRDTEGRRLGDLDWAALRGALWCCVRPQARRTWFIGLSRETLDPGFFGGSELSR